MLDQTLPGDLGTELLDRLNALAKFTEGGPGLTRRPFTPEHKAANHLITSWMERADLDVTLDAAGTLVGRKPGPENSKTFLIGSHQDSIRHGGKYDGMLGIALPILVLEYFRDVELPYSIEVLAFADEEGVRFPTALMGPRVLAGTFDPDSLNLRDVDGISLRQALAEFGGNPERLSNEKRDPEGTIGYLEVHIEQGPILEAESLSVGVVTAICGIERWTVNLKGQAAHAGTTPMALRRDAFAGAAEIALKVEAVCSAQENMVGVVGNLEVLPNVVNAIPGSTVFTIELRASSDGVRSSVGAELTAAIEDIATRRNLGFEISKTYAQGAVPCDDGLSALLGASIYSCGIEPFRLMSGATHDASAMSDLCPVAMLFTRCTGGLSHHPDEAITPEDALDSANVVSGFLNRLKDHVSG